MIQVVKTLGFHYRDLIPGWGTQILLAMQNGQKIKKKKKKNK